ncbi:MAG: hypothetical protein GC161_17250 [Planctomycetaceae bacterium]|nr:hypothetical protein [Planctomycetaceae bacterium]
MSASQGPWTGHFVWHDLMTKDGAAAQAFYSELLGWKGEAHDMGGFVYRRILVGGAPIGGIVEEPGIPRAHWMPYLAVEDVDRAAKRVAELGGTVCVPPTDIPRTGRFAVVGEPTGGTFSLYTGLPGCHGANPTDTMPGRACWNELYSLDLAKSQAFFTALAGWQIDVKDMGPAGSYHVQKLGDKQTGGMMGQPMAGEPSTWLVYFHVANLAESTARAKGLGAAAVMESMPIPEVGAFSMLNDPTGALFALFEPLASAKSC